MRHNGFANSGEDLPRRIFLGPFAVEHQFVIRTKKKVDANLPLATAPRVEMWGQVVRGVEPEIQAFQDNDLYPSHARPGFIEPPEYEYTPYRTCWQSLALDRCPVRLTSRSPRRGRTRLSPSVRPKTVPKPVRCLTASESAPIALNRLERAGV